jgi:hypothetical protein
VSKNSDLCLVSASAHAVPVSAIAGMLAGTGRKRS